jgi:hypothetical protein
MKFKSFSHRISQWLIMASLLSFGLVMAQSEPTLAQVYSTAQTGKLDQAQLMIQQVLISHPNSAKAFFVQSELYARQGNVARAQESLASAEKLAPGLPFAKAEAVQALRAQLSAKNAPSGSNGQASHAMAAPMQAPPSSSSSWALPLLLAGGVIGLGYFIFRKKPPVQNYQQPAYDNQGGPNGPQSFGSGAGTLQPGYGQPQYGQAGYGQPAGTGLGGRIMGGVATGLAVGAGVMAAEAIGRNLMGGGNHTQPTANSDSFGNNAYQPIQSNTDMGGQDFGVNDTSSWDDAGSADVASSGDWDN